MNDDVTEKIELPKEPAKRWYLSKTIWTNLVMGVLVLAVPKLGDFLTEDMLAAIFMVVNIILRVITKDKLELYR